MHLISQPSLFLSLTIFLSLSLSTSIASIFHNPLGFVDPHPPEVVINHRLPSPLSRHPLNAIDNCWRSNPLWRSIRPKLATCAVGFCGKMTNNIGPTLRRYKVWDPTDDNPADPKKGTLRYAATLLKGKIWITFKRSMTIKLKMPLLVSSYTAIDGRGTEVHITGRCLMLWETTNVIIHGLNIHDCFSDSTSADVATPVGLLRIDFSDGDGIRVVNSSKIWIDHNTLYNCDDGLIDVTIGSTNITISNNWFKNQDKVMLLGHDDGFPLDRNMEVTVAFNRFGPHCVQRMPRVRYGYAHVVNNLYQGWEKYALGGTMDPVIMSEGNYFIAPDTTYNKEVTWGEHSRRPHFYTQGDFFENGASLALTKMNYAKVKLYDVENRFPILPATLVKSMVLESSGAFKCKGARCWVPQPLGH